MSTPTYPGQGLPPPQLFFALNEELKYVAHSPSWVAYDHFRRTVLTAPLTQIPLRHGFKTRPEYEVLSLSPLTSRKKSTLFMPTLCAITGENLPPTCNLVIQLELVTQTDQLLHKNPSRTRKRFSTGHRLLPLASCRYSCAAQCSRLEI